MFIAKSINKCTHIEISLLMTNKYVDSSFTHHLSLSAYDKLNDIHTLLYSKQSRILNREIYGCNDDDAGHTNYNANLWSLNELYCNKK